MNFSSNELRAFVHGAAYVTEEVDGLHFHKCTERQENAWKQLNDVLYSRSFTTSGIRLEFETDAKSLSFSAPKGNRFELWVNGLFYRQFRLDELREHGEKPFAELGNGNKRFMLAFPSHTVGVISDLSLDGASYARPINYARRLLFLGDSITQGWNSTYNTLSFAYRTAMNLNADFLINGIGGAYYATTTFDAPPFDPDTVILAYGTNDFSKRSIEENITNTNGYLDLVKKFYGDRRVVVLTPIWRSDKDAEWLNVARSVIADAASKRGFETVDGDQLFPKNTAFFADGRLHPNDLGFSIYADRLTKYLTEKSL